ncbi:MAG: Clostripain family protein [Mediterranea sp.]|jgi:hypothetical protein|nr:Clostripain family protein [Mediterranea sp.]
MSTSYKFYRIFEASLLALCLSLSVMSCRGDKADDIIPVDPPVEEETDEPVEPNTRSTISQTVFMYLPWSTDLKSYFITNIEGMEATWKVCHSSNERIVVFLADSGRKATLFELLYKKDGTVGRRTLKEYDNPTFTTAGGIAAILGDVVAYSPAERYSMIIGSHGMGWIPVPRAKARRATDFKWHWEYDGEQRTRYFGGRSAEYQTDISALAEGIHQAGIGMEYILFDDCYMSCVEVAYELREVTHYLVASTSEIMIDGMPYAEVGRYLLGEADYQSLCDGFYDFYSTFSTPCGTIGVTDCSELDELAEWMRGINAQYAFDEDLLADVQTLDGYQPVIFFDMGDYVRKLCTDPVQLEEFEEILARVVPYKRHTPTFYTTAGYSPRQIPINTYSGITISDPSVNAAAASKTETAWYAATQK